ncbi:mucoidy inhibitor MuiA family protein [Actibacterium sp. 188UL27-1]|uniref:mucoidy inhibitor MuiA family protein n=1 Tax=Actibacterium sp. 188UL27-1 TaxID=2786961 RepID=UPI00195BB29D|nr:mucoidy inhibitor MuiA family protein [Actibacterium sp. 188UL27-1]MBM7067148.1 DUF4139 domain-containing protein [Actibacterium sp. 188UL27-1]
MRSILVLAFSVSPALADDFTAIAPVTTATLYGAGAVVTQQATVDLPEGRHRILIPASRGLMSYALPKITVSDGVAIGNVALQPRAVADAETAYLPQQAEALATLTAAQETLISAEGEVSQARAGLTAIEAQIAFLGTASAAQVEALDAETLLSTLQLIGTQRQDLERRQTEAQLALRPLLEAAEDATKARDQAQLDFDRLTPADTPVDLIAVNVDVTAAGPATVELESFTFAAGWQPVYDIFLARGDAPSVDIHRKAAIRQDTGLPWSDVVVRLSTGDPLGQVDPTKLWPNKAEIGNNAGAKRLSAPSPAASLSREADPLEQMAMEEADVATGPTIATDGVSISYDYPQPVSLSSGAGNLVLTLDQLEFTVDETIRAIPRFDETAFLMVAFVNDTVEPILAGQATLFRDGVRLAQSHIDYVAAGDEAELAFGKMEGIRLDWKLLQNDTGDRGLVSRSDIREQSLEFKIKNLMSEPQTVQTLYAMPFSEQEDLDIRVRANPGPDLRDFEQDRGIAAWDLTLEPGQEQIIRLDVTLTWPLGQGLAWQP